MKSVSPSRGEQHGIHLNRADRSRHGNALAEITDLSRIHEILTANYWTAATALCMLLFLLFHFPCSTTLLTIHKETGSWKWTLAAWGIPTAVGILLCGVVHWTAVLLAYICKIL